MHGQRADSAARARQLLERMGAAPRSRVAIFPPYTALAAVRPVIEGTAVALGAQDLHWEAEGAYTGEISGPMLADAGCGYVIVGHSERRHQLGEDDAQVRRKLEAALRAGLTPIVCVGERLSEREAGRTDEVVTRQVRAALDGLSAAASRTLCFAYEPVWAIGTGRVATPAQAAEAHARVRATADHVSGAGLGEGLCVLYGGSVKAENAAALFAEEQVDGVLVGGASLDADGFVRIVAAADAATSGPRG